jgi:hypothetical protein
VSVARGAAAWKCGGSGVQNIGVALEAVIRPATTRMADVKALK